MNSQSPSPHKQSYRGRNSYQVVPVQTHPYVLNSHFSQPTFAPIYEPQLPPIVHPTLPRSKTYLVAQNGRLVQYEHFNPTKLPILIPVPEPIHYIVPDVEPYSSYRGSPVLYPNVIKYRNHFLESL